jgi:2'-5' RNA ligase
MKIFVGVELPKKISNEITKIRNSDFENIVDIKWIEESDCYITLKFLGRISNLKIERIIQRLKKITFEDFELESKEVGFFHNDRFIEVIFLGLKPEKKIIELHNKVDYELRDIFGLDKTFKGHIILGRIENIKNKEKFFEKIKNLKLKTNKFKVKNFKLVKNEDGMYKILEVFE